ncbi:hypothetical protein Bca4012_076799 [Brassica carinata]|uniref:Uncharacterized protein n=1 Tax=Brassica carinata TaxID=52824 RepID=A0A8X7U676_BRACI|nr:hypothetical protein Bca52824_072940 [Brassica carinata]
MNLWIVPLSIKTTTSTPLMLPRSLMVWGDESPTTELTDNSATSVYSSSLSSTVSSDPLINSVSVPFS